MSRTARNLDWSTDADQPSLDDPKATARERTAFIERAVADAGADGVVLALTGGVDAAVAAALAAEALGPEAVRGLVPTPDPVADRTDGVDADQTDGADADRIDGTDTDRTAEGDADPTGRRVATELGIATRSIDVEPYVDALARSVLDDPELLAPPEARPDGRPGGRATRSDAEDSPAAFRDAAAVSLGELAAAVEATASSRLVLGPGTRTSLVGGSPVQARTPGVDLLPLGDLYLTEVRELARCLDVPADCADAPPTDALWVERTATADGPLTAETMDAVLWKLLDDGAGIEQTADALDVAPGLVGRIAVRYARRARRCDAGRPIARRTDSPTAAGRTPSTGARSPAESRSAGESADGGGE